MRIALAFVVLLLPTLSIQARLGESFLECVKRYGEPKGGSTPVPGGDADVWAFEKNKMVIYCAIQRSKRPDVVPGSCNAVIYADQMNGVDEQEAEILIHMNATWVHWKNGEKDRWKKVAEGRWEADGGRYRAELVPHDGHPGKVLKIEDTNKGFVMDQMTPGEISWYRLGEL